MYDTKKPATNTYFEKEAHFKKKIKKNTNTHQPKAFHHFQHISGILKIGK